MEKIYMEDNNNKKKKRSVVDASVVLSFAVAIFAIFSLVMADLSLSQRSGVSYAAPDAEWNDITFKIGDKLDAYYDGSTSVFTVSAYTTSDNNPLFCVQHNNDHIVDNSAYATNDDVGSNITDYGLLYLLNSSYANGVNIIKANTQGVLGADDTEKAANAKAINTWITQTAIWVYLYEINGTTAAQSSNENYISQDELNVIKEATKIKKKVIVNNVVQSETDIYDGPKLSQYVDALVNGARSQSDVGTLSVNLDSSDILTDEKKDFYFSSPITVSGIPQDRLKNYTISVTGIEGAEIVDENGDVLDIANKTFAYPSEAAPFRIRIPAEKVTKEVQKVNVSVKGTFNTLVGKYYTGVSDANLQKIVSVKAGERNISKGVEVEFFGGEDTGMSTAQTIYFIGLIVLLCGVGIVYANAKPVQVKQ